ncbi:MAG TPA: hypothetical protein VGL72_11345 [Bryobacteraceae bacterium]|jgi:hypothetical protein
MTRPLTLALVLTLTAAAAHASTYYYANWTADTLSSLLPGSVTGTIGTPQGTVAVTYTGDVAPWTQINNLGNNYFSAYPSVFTSSTVSNLPSNVDLITLSQSHAFVDTITFSTPVTNPILDIVSLGQSGNSVSYNFNAAPVILSQGASFFGGCPNCLFVGNGKTLTGVEGDGVVEFLGTFSQLSWTTTGGEAWNGVTVAVAGEAISQDVSPDQAADTPEPASWTGLFMAAGLITVARRRPNRRCQ